MHRRIRITAGEVKAEATLTHSDSAEAVWQALPLRGRASLWGDEIYFQIPVDVEEALDARDEMGIGEVAYWPAGSAFCVFFGPTPASRGNEPRAASPVNPLGMVEGDPSVFGSVQEGAEVTVEVLEEVEARVDDGGSPEGQGPA